LSDATWWKFKTGASQALGPAPVALGQAAHYAILAQTALINSSRSSIAGNVGLSPAGLSSITGISFKPDIANQFALSDSINGEIFTADMSPPTPVNVAEAIKDMRIAYNDAASRALPDFTYSGGANIDGTTLIPGLYDWGTDILIMTGVTLSGGPHDVWIFQIASDLLISDGAVITLSGGAQPGNIYWQVAGQAILGSKCDFKGNILSLNNITLRSGARISGRALSQTIVSLDSSRVALPGQ